jgi:hypothetical protein
VCIKTKAKKSVTITITIAIILFSCNAWDDYKVRFKDSIRSVKCRLCTSCGTKAANEWADKIHHILLKVPHRHVVFTVSDKMRELLKNPKYQKVLFAASKITMEEMVASSNKKSKKKTKLKIGMIQVLQTFGADI